MILPQCLNVFFLCPLLPQLLPVHIRQNGRSQRVSAAGGRDESRDVGCAAQTPLRPQNAQPRRAANGSVPIRANVRTCIDPTLRQIEGHSFLPFMCKQSTNNISLTNEFPFFYLNCLNIICIWVTWNEIRCQRWYPCDQQIRKLSKWYMINI